MPTKTSSNARKILDSLRGIYKFDERSINEIKVLAYLASFVKEDEKNFTIDSKRLGLLAKQTPKLFQELLNYQGFANLGAIEILANDFSSEELRNFVLLETSAKMPTYSFDEHTTPDCICNLALRLLDIKADDSVADICCGTGTFLAKVAKSCDCKELYGNDINSQSLLLAIARMDILGANATIDIADALNAKPVPKYTKLLSNFPFALAYKSFENNNGYAKTLLGKNSPFRRYSCDWLFSRIAYDYLAEGGTAVTIVTVGSTLNGLDQKARAHFVDNGMIKAVIALPKNLFLSTAIQSDLVILGKNEGHIRFVDATDLYVEGRRWDSMGADEIDEVISRLNTDGPLSRLVDPEEIAANDYNLHPVRYVEAAIEVVNPTRFGDVILSLERGANYRGDQLDALTTREDTGLSYLKLGDISDGIIASELSHLTEINPKFEKQCLKTGDLVFSKNGAPFKIAVVDLPEDEKVLANGNLYIVRLDTERVDPYFIAAFFQSDDGKELMEREVVGTSIPNLPVRNLENIKIPCPSLDVQHRVGEAYKASLDEIEILRIKLEKARFGIGEAYAKEMAR